MEYTDTHTHTWYSGHGTGTVEEVVAAAAAKGLTTVALTEHLPLPPEVDSTGTFGMTEDQVALYLADFAQARAAHPNIEVIRGIEVDWREGAESYILERLFPQEDAGGQGSQGSRGGAGGQNGAGGQGSADSPYELILGSVHMLSDADGNTWEFDHPDYIDGWYERGEEQVWHEYLRLWSDAVRSAVPFAIMSHPDLPKKLGFAPTFDPREFYAAMAETAASRGVMVEVNTSGLHKPIGEVYPGPALLKAFCDAGVACTVSSDAHKPSEVGRDLDKAHAALRAAGYTHVTVPTSTGDRRTILL
jgi:histidinol-phosphatase (PHP family)